MIREPAVAGSFYPGVRTQLERQLDDLVPEPAEDKGLAVVLPHAGYIYSGGIAGETIARVAVPGQIVLLGPNHHGIGPDFAVSPADAWRTPLGDTEVDGDLAQALVEQVSFATFDEIAHNREHSLEVLIPFIQWRNPAARIVPVCIKSHDLDHLLEFGAQLGELLAHAAEPILLIASSDMSHFLTAVQARERDHLAIDRVLELDPRGLFQTVRQHRITMCGVAPCVSLLQAVKSLGAVNAELVRYGHSGEQTGDDSEVVGYAGMLVH